MAGAYRALSQSPSETKRKPSDQARIILAVRLGIGCRPRGWRPPAERLLALVIGEASFTSGMSASKTRGGASPSFRWSTTLARLDPLQQLPGAPDRPRADAQRHLLRLRQEAVMEVFAIAVVGLVAAAEVFAELSFLAMFCAAVFWNWRP